ncbi:hypothetical protein ZEAMMB73_Zm00001d034300 [Zea mays]|uniref:Uncharacterized protein n=1 Tax=Zea mays TaxID=4577 RepID=A0A1D6L6L4_MAIZE|nr:hypothetical protein ZEAMMB73_Zm00001d034300 [Zea mays]
MASGSYRPKLTSDFSGDKCRRSEETARYKDLQLQLPSKSDLQPPATPMVVMPSRETDNIAEHGHNAAKHVASLISVDTPKVGPDIQRLTTKKRAFDLLELDHRR